MSPWAKSLLLILLRQQLEQERTGDWQEQHKRDRNWRLEQEKNARWPLLQHWLERTIPFPDAWVAWVSRLLGFAAFLIGFGLVAGLVEFRVMERINLFWFMLFTVILPLLWWLAGLLLHRSLLPVPLQGLFEQRLGLHTRRLIPRLLPETTFALAQQLSLIFSIGLVSTFLITLTFSDLAFGWATTLEISSDVIHRLTSLLAWPWKNFWPAASPSLELIDQTRFFRSAPLTTTPPQRLGEWWPFLLMCLLVYNLLPRLISFGASRLRLARRQQRLLHNDALISGLLTRLDTELVDQAAEHVEQLALNEAQTSEKPRQPAATQAICWGFWPETLLQQIKEQLQHEGGDLHWLELTSEEQLPGIIEQLQSLPDQPTLLLCKGWEPPTGELIDLCQTLAGIRQQLLLWPVPLQGMNDQRRQILDQSWDAFLQQTPEQLHRIDKPLERGKTDE